MVVNHFLESISCHGNKTKFNHMERKFVEEFGKKSNVKNWILYHDASSKNDQVNRIWHDAMKNKQNLGYFVFENSKNPRSSNISGATKNEKSSNLGTLHLIIPSNLNSAKRYILKNATLVYKSNQSFSDIRLIRMPKMIKEEQIFRLMTDLKIGYDTKIFFYLIDRIGNINVYYLI